MSSFYTAASIASVTCTLDQTAALRRYNLSSLGDFDGVVRAASAAHGLALPDAIATALLDQL